MFSFHVHERRFWASSYSDTRMSLTGSFVLHEELERRAGAAVEVSGNEDESRGTEHPHRDRGLAAQAGPPPVVTPYVHGDSAWHDHQGWRVVEYQHALQTVSDPLLGWATIGAHFRTSGASMIAGYLGNSDKVDRAMSRFARAYADQTERDHQALVTAVARGVLPAS